MVNNDNDNNEGINRIDNDSDNNNYYRYYDSYINITIKMITIKMIIIRILADR